MFDIYGCVSKATSSLGQVVGVSGFWGFGLLAGRFCPVGHAFGFELLMGVLRRLM